MIIDVINSKLNSTNKFKYSYQLQYYHKPLQKPETSCRTDYLVDLAY